MSTTASLWMFGRFLRMVVAQQFGRPVLERVPEPCAETAEGEQVLQYNQAKSTKLTLPYACGLELIHRARNDGPAGTALDLACGPGHFTLLLARYLGFQSVSGMDLSAGMVEAARQNAAAEGLSDRVEFHVGDATRTDYLGDGAVDLTCFTHAAHHLSTLDAVRHVMREMDRVTRPDGVVLLLDLARLRTARLTERFVEVVAADYARQGLSQLRRDFRNSLYAAWTVQELRLAIPRASTRLWCHIVPRGLPTLQAILGLPVGRTKPFVRPGVPWPPDQGPVPDAMVSEWNLLRWTLRLGSWSFFPPSKETAPVAAPSSRPSGYTTHFDSGQSSHHRSKDHSGEEIAHE